VKLQTVGDGADPLGAIGGDGKLLIFSFWVRFNWGFRVKLDVEGRVKGRAAYDGTWWGNRDG